MVNECIEGRYSEVVVEVYVVNIYIVHLVFITWICNVFC